MPDEDVDELMRRRMQVELPVDVEERLRSRLVEFRTKVEQHKPRREWMRMPVVRMAAPAQPKIGANEVSFTVTNPTPALIRCVAKVCRS